MIYIDPPYNTGKDFVYKDDYTDNLRNYQEITGQIDCEGNRLSTNSDSDGRYHSNWLSMMYPRLILARNLLQEDGVLFVSIDHREIANLKCLMDDIFGESNFVAIFKWNKTSTPPSLSRKVRHKYEYVLCYERAYSPKEYTGGYSEGGDMPLLNDGNPISVITIPKESLLFKFNGRYAVGKYGRVRLLNDIDIVDGYSVEDVHLEGPFKWVQDNLNKEIGEGTTFVIKSEKFAIRYIRPGGRYKKPSDIISKKECEVGTNEDAGKEIKSLFGSNVMSFPKPVSLMQYLIKFVDTNDEIILDFFAGSSSSAHAVLSLNREDGYNRQFIQVQLPEPTNDDSDAKKAGFMNIAEIGKERIRRVVNQIKQEDPIKAEAMDLGFKVFKLDSSNIKSWDGSPENLEQSLFDSVENIKRDRSQEDVLYEILLKYGLDLFSPVQERIIENQTVFNVGSGSLFVCLGDDIDGSVAEGIGQWKEACNPEFCRVVFEDSGFTDVEKVNSFQILKKYGIREVRSI
ncbi:MAG: site-specific DNA-methyltransferase [Paracoccaceae bacterium]|nr:site-specific DNA-methyltransferase [Paracoccaceae bacterium]